MITYPIPYHIMYDYLEALQKESTMNPNHRSPRIVTPMDTIAQKPAPAKVTATVTKAAPVEQPPDMVTLTMTHEHAALVRCLAANAITGDDNIQDLIRDIYNGMWEAGVAVRFLVDRKQSVYRR